MERISTISAAMNLALTIALRLQRSDTTMQAWGAEGDGWANSAGKGLQMSLLGFNQSGQVLCLAGAQSGLRVCEHTQDMAEGVQII